MHVCSHTQSRIDTIEHMQVVYQIGSRALEDRVMLELLCSIAQDPFYESLRTQQQLGYIVSSGARRTEVSGAHDKCDSLSSCKVVHHTRSFVVRRLVGTVVQISGAIMTKAMLTNAVCLCIW